MKKVLFVFAALIFNARSFAQNITVSSSHLDFGAAYENAPVSLPLTIYNNIGRTVNIPLIKFYNILGSPAFSVVFWGDTIPNGDSLTVLIRFSPIHNIHYNSELIIENTSLRGYLSVDLNGQGKYSNTYYNATENLSEEN